MSKIVKKRTGPRPLVLITLEGWGVAPAHSGNAITEADPAYFKSLLSHYPALTLEASGPAVGLGAGKPVTSEEGYALIGSGRPHSDVTCLIDETIKQGSFGNGPELASFLKGASGRRLHLIGLLSPSDCEASLTHLEALLAAAREAGVTEILLHAILDGRDASATAGRSLVSEWEERLAPIGRVASLSGRFYALDPYRSSARISKAVEVIVGRGNRQSAAVQAITEAYAMKIFDEEFPPTVIREMEQPCSELSAADSVFFFNVSPMNIQALAKGLLTAVPGIHAMSLTDYGLGEMLPAAFHAPSIGATLGSCISAAGLRQLRLSDSEGFSGITAFLNGGSEMQLAGEERLLLPTPLLEDYAERPGVVNDEIAKQAVKAIEDKKFDFIAIAFASIDRLAHAANLEGTIESIRSVDDALERIVTTALAAGGAAVITATHGLAEQTITPDTDRFSSHTGRIVPLLLVAKELEGFSLGFQQPIDGDLSPLSAAGTLCDVAPTILRLMHLPIDESMSGISLYDAKNPL